MIDPQPKDAIVTEPSTPNDADLIAALEDDERRLVLRRFDNADAWRLGTVLARPHSSGVWAWRS